MEILNTLLEIAAIVGIVAFLWSVSDSLKRIADAVQGSGTDRKIASGM
jgi:hypothetical protein